MRDSIPVLIEQKGGRVTTHIADDLEYGVKLLEKLHEEALEALESKDEAELLKELADVQEVVLALLKHNKFTLEQLEEARRAKLADRGGFDGKIILEKAEQVEKL